MGQIDWSKVKVVKAGKIPPAAKQIHLYEVTDVLRPRGHMEKDSIGLHILGRLMSAYEYWTAPIYGDNPDTETLIELLRKNLMEEVEGAWEQFIEGR